MIYKCREATCHNLIPYFGHCQECRNFVRIPKGYDLNYHLPHRLTPDDVSTPTTLNPYIRVILAERDTNE